VLFIDHSPKGINMKDYQEHGWNYTNIYLDKEAMTWDLFFHKIIRRFLPTWSKTVLYSFFENLLIIETNKTILLDYIIWNIFTDNYIIENYMKRLLPDTASKIHILSQSSIKTWLIFPDNTSIDYYLDWDEKKQNQTLFSFMYYDYAVMYGNITVKFFKKHRNFIKEYIANGVLFSQIAQEIKKGKLSSPLNDIIKQKKLPKKLIGVFDTSVSDIGMIKIKDGVQFGKDILKILEDFPDTGIIFKAMKWPGFTPELDLIYDKIKNHERCLMFYMWGDKGISVAEVIAASDFVISCSYTSPTAEALGARVKAIYYDVSGHDIGEKYYYNRYPNFVAHNYKELKKLMNYWLNEVTNDEFEEFLIKYVKDEIDPYLDGKALTRLRKLLT
jgi:polysaccharide biosynthesis PFTS motif protein